MAEAILTTKLHVPAQRTDGVARPRLIDRLNEGLDRDLTLISAPAGFGKSTLLSDWVRQCEAPVAWLSLDEGDSDTIRFLTHLLGALQAVAPDVGSGPTGALRSPQPPSTESVLTTLVNEIAALPNRLVLVLDDYHTVDAKPIDDALAFLIEHLPEQMHVVVSTREDPQIPVARLRARSRMTELRAADLRFSRDESARFLNQAMGLSLSANDVAALEARTEGWIAGLQLAALSLRDREDPASFIESFTGSHRFILDYLVEEVLQQQPKEIQSFLLRTSILDRMCGPLCDSVTLDSDTTGQQTLERLERANIFVIPLDDERRWYRYHHLFADLLRQRLHQADGDGRELAQLHLRASRWLETQGLEIEAFRHAAASDDIDRAERLALGGRTPLHVRGATSLVRGWLESLPVETLSSRPSLLVMFAGALSVAGQTSRVEEKLQTAEASLQDIDSEVTYREVTGRIADLRALLALLSGDPEQLETVVSQSLRALEYLDGDNPAARAGPYWRLGLAHQYLGDRDAATDAHQNAIDAGEASGNVHVQVLAWSCVGALQESDNQLRLAAQTHRRALQLVGDPPGPVACEAHVGLARVHYEWNNLDTAAEHGETGAALARQIEISNFVNAELFLARLKLAQGNVTGTLAVLDQTESDARRRGFLARLPQIASARVKALLLLGDLEAASHVARSYDLPISLARVRLAQGDPGAVLAALEPAQRRAAERGWKDEQLSISVLQALAHHSAGEQERAFHRIGEALVIAGPEGFIRTFIDEGEPMRALLSDYPAGGIASDYTRRLLAAFESGETNGHLAPSQPLIEPLSNRELEVLRLVAQGLSNRQISDRLFLALSTVKGHNRVIFGKLQVQRRTEAIARARELGLL